MFTKYDILAVIERHISHYLIVNAVSLKTGVYTLKSLYKHYNYFMCVMTNIDIHIYIFKKKINNYRGAVEEHDRKYDITKSNNSKKNLKQN